MALPPGRHRLDIGLLPLPPDELDLSGAAPRWRVQRAHAKPVIFAGGDHSPFLVNAGISHPPAIIETNGALLRHVRLDWDFDAGPAGTISGRVTDAAFGGSGRSLHADRRSPNANPTTSRCRWWFKMQLPASSP